MSNNFIDVHTFDGKLQGIFAASGSYKINEKKDAFSHLIKLLTDPAAIMTTQTMINDLAHEHGSNYHPANNLDASDILMEIINWVDNPDVLKMLNEQLGDVKKLGICNSGRVTRLLQVWVAFVHTDKENEEENKRK